jgi:hypothetical protein
VQETDIGRIVFLGQPRQKKFLRLHLSGKKLEMVVHICHLSDSEKLKIERSQYRPIWAKEETLSPKITRAKRSGGKKH